MLHVTGVILSGGKSSRMVENKAFTQIGGERIIDIILAKFKTQFREIIIVSNEPELYRNLGVTVVRDVIPARGPLSGLHSGLVHSRTGSIFAVACDMPFIDMGLAASMIRMLSGYDAIAPMIKGRFQPLFAAYSCTCLPIFEDCLLNDKLKISRVFEEGLEVRYITEQEVSCFGDPEVIFFNVNSRENLLKAREMQGEVIL